MGSNDEFDGPKVRLIYTRNRLQQRINENKMKLRILSYLFFFIPFIYQFEETYLRPHRQVGPGMASGGAAMGDAMAVVIIFGVALFMAVALNGISLYRQEKSSTFLRKVELFVFLTPMALILLATLKYLH